MKANLQKDRPLVIGYISAIIAALLFGCVSTVAKPIVSTLNPLMLASLVYLISGLAITPVVKSKVSLSKKDYSLLFVTSISGAAIAPAMFFSGLKLTTAGGRLSFIKWRDNFFDNFGANTFWRKAESYWICCNGPNFNGSNHCFNESRI